MTFVGLRSKVRALAAVILLAALGACGSGGDLGSDPSAPPAITTQPASETANDQGTTTFSVTAAGEGLSYQWQRNGTDIADATLAIYTTPVLSLGDSGAIYTVIVSNGGGSVTSSPATLTVVPAPPTVSTQPADATVVDDDTATFSVTARGTAPLSYQWYRNGAAIAGATAVTYTTAATDVQDSGATFRVVVTGSVGTTQSRDARLTVTARPPTITTHPANSTAANQGVATFSVQASGTTPFTYQWYRNAVPIAGATAATLTMSPVTFGDDQAIITVVVSNGGGSATSLPATLTVTATVAAQAINVCQDITSAGAYTLGADLNISIVSATCITVSASNVQLDCANRLISATATNASAIDVANASHVSVKNCRLQTERMTLDRATRVTVSGNTFTPRDSSTETTVLATHGDELAFNGNTIETGTVNSRYGRNTALANNTISARAGASGPEGAIKVSWGSGTRVFGNTLDGRWNSNRGATVRDGAQAALAVVDERDITIDGNTMRNLFTCGVEITGNVTQLVARGNRVENAGQCGFGGNQWLSVSSSRFVANTVDRSGGIFHLYRTLGLRPAGTDPEGALPADSAVVFRDIVVEANVLTNPLPPDGSAQGYPASIIPTSSLMDYPLSGPGSVSSIPGERAAVAGDFQITALSFTANNFGRTGSGPVSFGSGPFTAGTVVDGGRNVCPVSGLAGYPINCT